MTVAELLEAARQVSREAMVNLLVKEPTSEDWREAADAYPDREWYGGGWRESLTLVVGDAVE